MHILRPDFAYLSERIKSLSEQYKSLFEENRTSIRMSHWFDEKEMEDLLGSTSKLIRAIGMSLPLDENATQSCFLIVILHKTS
jgi:hypothetical protein